MSVDIQRSDHDEVTTLTVAGTLSIANTRQLGGHIYEIIEGRRLNIVIDLAGLDSMDNVGLDTLLTFHKRIKTMGGEVQLINVQGQPLDLIKLRRREKVLLG